MKEYFKLLVKREYKVVLGKYCSNLFLLTLVMFATFMSIAFSHGSMIYLEEKMNDPFTLWVDISSDRAEANLENLKDSLSQDAVKSRFGIEGVQSDIYYPITFADNKGKSHYLRVRYVEDINCALIDKILDEENLVAGCRIPSENLVKNTIGFIITEDMLHKLNYSVDSIPAYINFLSYAGSVAELYGLNADGNDNAPAPVPLLAVVKRLPMGMDAFGTVNYISQQGDDAFKLSNEEYHRRLLYFIENSPEEFETAISSILPDSLKSGLSVVQLDDKQHLMTWQKGCIVQVYVGDEVNSPTSLYVDINKKILSLAASSAAVRLYDYKLDSELSSEYNDYLSIQFKDLTKIREFEQYAKNDDFQVTVEMSQVNAKENFNSVSTMANILSWAMIAFAIVCIIMYIVNMMQNYFQKIKRNMGTFKAFGISSYKLIGVYMLIILVVLALAILIALAVTWLVEILLPEFGIMKDGVASYLALWNYKTFFSVLIVLLSTMFTIYFVMKKILGRTPGDLIYDRD